MSPTPGPDCLGLISNSDKTGSGQEHDLSYRIMVDAGLTPAELITADLSPVFLFAQSISRRAVTSGRVLPLFKTKYVARRPRRYPRRGSGPGALLCEYGTLFASGEALFLNNRGRSRVHWAHETAQLIWHTPEE